MLFINAKVYTQKLLATTNCDSRPSIHLIEFEGFIDGGCIKHTRYNKRQLQTQAPQSGPLTLFSTRKVPYRGKRSSKDSSSRTSPIPASVR